jgi:thioredoxin 1
MKRLYIHLVWCLILLSSSALLEGAEQDINSLSASPKPSVVNDLYPGLTTGALTYAVASELPNGALLKAGELVIRDKDLADEIAKAQKQMQPMLRKNALLFLEQIATSKLVLAEAKAEAVKSGLDISKKDEQSILQDYVQSLVKNVKVTDTEVVYFYNNNKDAVGGAPLTLVKPQIEQFLLQQKQQDHLDKLIRTIGRRMKIEISGSWLKVQAASAKDNPVDKARESSRPSLVDFGSKGCIPCDMMAPILETLRKKYEGKVNVIFIHIGEEPILASRYGVQTIPVQAFFDKTGREVFRHVGFFAQDEIEKKLAEMGVK